MHNSLQFLRKQYFLYVVLLAIIFFSYGVMYSPQPMYASIARDLGTSMAHAGLLVSVFMLTLSFAPLIVGLVISALGVRRAIGIASFILCVSSAGFFLVADFASLLGLRLVQGLVVPVLMTAAMANIAYLFRHLDLRRALAGFVTASLFGSLSGRVIGGFLAQAFGWRIALALFAAAFFFILLCIRFLPDPPGSHAVPPFRDITRCLRQQGVAVFLAIEACGIFTFAALGNVLPLRMLEIASSLQEGAVGLMYLGYSVGLVASLAIGPLSRCLGSTARLLLFGAALYLLSLLTLWPASVLALFLGLWSVAFGEFVVHSIAPGLVNQFAARQGTVDRNLVNSLFLSTYYLGGLLGSWIPGFLYTAWGWSALILCLCCVQGLALLLVLFAVRTIPEIH